MAVTRTVTRTQTLRQTVNVQSASSNYTLNAVPPMVAEGQQVVFTLSPAPTESLASDQNYGWEITFGTNVAPSSAVTEGSDPDNLGIFTWDTTGAVPGVYSAALTLTDPNQTSNNPPGTLTVTASPVTVTRRPIASGDVVPVAMMRTAEPPTSDTSLWVVIRNSANNMLFDNYKTFIDSVMCNPASLDANVPVSACGFPPLSGRRFLPFPNMDAYRVLKVATECFLMMNCGVYMTPQALQSLLNQQGYDLTSEATRINQSAAGVPDQVVSWWKMYLASGNQYLNKSSTDPSANDPQNMIIPYLALVRSRLSDLALKDDCSMGIQCYGILKNKLTNPCLLELIWSYWQEEGMLVQTLNAISRRFQNLRGSSDRDPLMRFDLDPLRRLNSLLWGYVQDEQHRLSVVRRAYEYNHEYGLTLEGKALRGLRPSDGRSKFLEAFHNLLYLCTIFFKEDDDTTVVADGFPVLNALKEVHYILAAGAANQFGELPSTARQEMLMQQWLLARPEMREFLGGKIMVPYPEEWMDRVDTVKTMQGWTDVSVIYFRDLAVYGEQIVLSVRYGAWSITNNPAQAANWARYWRPEIQAYTHAYRAATGVDLTSEPVNSTLPSVLLLRRLATQRPALRG
jgi:hypothetical protein